MKKRRKWTFDGWIPAFAANGEYPILADTLRGYDCSPRGIPVRVIVTEIIPKKRKVKK
jgi:hypothetical protein